MRSWLPSGRRNLVATGMLALLVVVAAGGIAAGPARVRLGPLRALLSDRQPPVASPSEADGADPLPDVARATVPDPGPATSTDPACATPLQTLINQAPPASVLNVPACIYRETIVVDKPLTLVGQPGTEIRGSDIWSNWTLAGSYWTAGPLPLLAGGGECAVPNTTCQWPEQVFVDGQPLDRVAADPSADQFAVDAGRNVVLGADPTGHTVEVSVRDRWLITKADHVTIAGFTFRHAANAAQSGAISNNSASNWTLEDSQLSDTSAGIVSVGGGSNNRVLNNDIARGGQWGVAGYQSEQALIQGNRIHDNNLHLFDPEWEAGGVKMVAHHGLTVDGNDIYDNNGPGLWCDILCRNVTFSDNRIHDNASYGILFEISDGGQIVDNTVWHNGLTVPVAAIYLSTSSNTEVAGNVLAWNPIGILVGLDSRSPAPSPAGVGNQVEDNTVIMGRTGQTALQWSQSLGTDLFSPTANNRGNGNAFWYPEPENDTTRFDWDGSQARLADFQSTAGGQNSRYLTNDEMHAALAAAGIQPA